MRTEHYEGGLITYQEAGFMGIAMTVCRTDGEQKIRFCECQEEIDYYLPSAIEWLAEEAEMLE